MAGAPTPGLLALGHGARAGTGSRLAYLRRPSRAVGAEGCHADAGQPRTLPYRGRAVDPALPGGPLRGHAPVPGGLARAAGALPARAGRGAAPALRRAAGVLPARAPGDAHPRALGSQGREPAEPRAWGRAAAPAPGSRSGLVPPWPGGRAREPPRGCTSWLPAGAAQGAGGLLPPGAMRGGG